MINDLRPALVMTVLLTLVTGIAYPLAITGIGQLAFPAQANGSLVRNSETVVGSSLIGQNFTSDRYFWPRPSMTADSPYNAASSSGSNLGPTSAALKQRVGAEVNRLRTSGMSGAIPADAATASASGLDPDISPVFAQSQVARVAEARGLPDTDVAVLVERFTQGRVIGIIGEPRVNVMALNMALDGLKAGQ